MNKIMTEEGQTVHTGEVFAVALRNWRDGGGAFKLLYWNQQGFSNFFASVPLNEI